MMTLHRTVGCYLQMLRNRRQMRCAAVFHHGVYLLFAGIPLVAGTPNATPACTTSAATHLCHFLADPRMWHKIDLVRVRGRKAPAGGAITRIY